MTVDGHTLIFDYDANGHPLTVTYDGYVFFYVTNLQGDVVGIVSGDGTQIVSYAYDAWGRVYNANDHTAGQIPLNIYNPLCYRGYVYDRETGLYYLQSRYYNPEWGRFINADDPAYLGADGTPVSYNLFAYCGNNPVMGYDPTGCFMLSTAVLIGAVIGGIIGAAAGGMVAYNVAKDSGAEGAELAAWTALGVVGGGIIGAAIGAAAGYTVGYFAGGTYANGLAAKAVNSGVKSFFSQ